MVKKITDIIIVNGTGWPIHKCSVPKYMYFLVKGGGTFGF
jgi:hypothetical protein